jgi:uncharacterized damage-inducible protein DinB
MKELFVAYSRYNQRANAIVFSCIDGMSAEQLGFRIKAFYPTVVDTVFHVMKSDLKWLHRLSSFGESPFPKDILASYMRGESVDQGLVAQNLHGFVALRFRIDAAIVALVAAIPEEAFDRDLEIEFGPKKIKRPLWQLLMQWFNHHTHHRGQVSIQLDALGIDNDFSGVLDKIE